MGYVYHVEQWSDEKKCWGTFAWWPNYKQEFLDVYFQAFKENGWHIRVTNLLNGEIVYGGLHDK